MIVPVQRTEYQSNGMPRPGELSVQPKSTARVGAHEPRRSLERLLSKYSPRSPRTVLPLSIDDSCSAGTTTYSRVTRPGPGA